jgi:hypothetical protein
VLQTKIWWGLITANPREPGVLRPECGIMFSPSPNISKEQEAILPTVNYKYEKRRKEIEKKKKKEQKIKLKQDKKETKNPAGEENQSVENQPSNQPPQE